MDTRPTDVEQVTPDQTNIREGLTTSLSIGLVPATLTWFVLRDLPLYLSLPPTIVVLGYSAQATYKGGVDQIVVPVGYKGVATIFGYPIRKTYSPGNHWGIPGVQGAINVNIQERIFDPPAFEELARNKVPVSINGFFGAVITDPYRWFNVGDADQQLTKLFDSEIRLFVSQWKRAEDLIVQRDLLADFLELPCDESEDPEAYAKLRARLDELTVGDDPALSEEGVKNIWEDAGKFCGNAARWGFSIPQIHVEDVDLPKRLKEAAEKRAAEPDAMADQKIRAAAIVEMSKSLKKELPGLTDRDVLNTVEMLLGLAVKQDNIELSFRDLDDIAGKIGKPAAEALARAFANWRKKSKGDN